MRITSLVENRTKTELKAKHGLALYIETKKHKILFDLGPDDTLFENAKKKNIDISKVDTVIISHGHVDHGGALEIFLSVNASAKIYIQKRAFEPHFTKTFFIKVSVGINKNLINNKQIVLLDGDYKIDDELSLFTADKTDRLHSPVNDVLYERNNKDSFLHEQNLIIKEDTTALIIGCGHSGIANIMDKAVAYNPQFCFGGFHLYNPINKKTVSEKLLNEIGSYLLECKPTQFYTCHCTGTKAFEYLSHKADNIHYFSCGESMELV